MALMIEPHSKLVMIGDSITDCGRTYPIGEGPERLGNGYVSLVDGLLRATNPQNPIRVVNMGISGNTVRDLKARWQRDVVALRPDWLAVMIGINDVWRQFDSWQPEAQVALPEYEATLSDLVANMRPQLKGLVLMTPYFIEPDRSHPMRQMMDAYGTAVQRIATHQQTLLVDTQATFDALTHYLPPHALAHDQIHPNLTGHLALAQAFLKALHFAW